MHFQPGCSGGLIEPIRDIVLFDMSILCCRAAVETLSPLQAADASSDSVLLLAAHFQLAVARAAVAMDPTAAIRHAEQRGLIMVSTPTHHTDC